jgi:hypothetical protein
MSNVIRFVSRRSRERITSMARRTEVTQKVIDFCSDLLNEGFEGEDIVGVAQPTAGSRPRRNFWTGPT